VLLKATAKSYCDWMLYLCSQEHVEANHKATFVLAKELTVIGSKIKTDS